MRHKAVRPVSVVRYLYPNTNVTAWAGPYKGVRAFPGAKWNSYLRTMPHSDYPSGTACICVAWAEYMEAFLGTPGKLNYGWTFPKGCSMREPGTVPAVDTPIMWETTEEFIKDCTTSRLWAGVHFKRSVDDTVRMCTGMGKEAYDKIKRLAAGRA